jgi:SpoIIAA-like
MIELIEDLPRNVVGISVRGRVTKQECREILTPAMQRSLKWRDKARLYYELGSRFPGAGWDDLDLGFGQASRCERVAIVTDIAWVRLTVQAIRFLIPGEIRVFATAEVPEARAWIVARPGSLTSAEHVTPSQSHPSTTRAIRRSSSRRPLPLTVTRPQNDAQRDRYAG